MDKHLQKKSNKKQKRKAQQCFIFQSEKWINCILNGEVYSSLEGVLSDHRTVSAMFRSSLRRNKR